jgi:hypothetical protein
LPYNYNDEKYTDESRKLTGVCSEMETILLSHEEVAHCAKQLYESSIRQKVESEHNVGKMVIIDIETGEYEVDKTGLQAGRNLTQKNPNARLFGTCIGYDVAASFGGIMKRVKE